MQKNTYSFVVPVYNAENYIARCVESILNGCMPDDELILVDDGSGDMSGAICDDYSKKYSNIMVIHQCNGGESIARNTGIEAASKEWIVFVDADDFLDSDFHRKLDENVDAQYDYVLFSYCREDAAVKRERAENKASKEFFHQDREELVKGCLRGRYGFVPEEGVSLRTAWAKALKRSFLIENGLKFPEHVFIGGDCLFMTQVYSKTKKSLYVNEVFYHYFFQNPDSITNRYKPNLKENKTAGDHAMETWLKENPQYGDAYCSYCLDQLILHVRDDFFHAQNTSTRGDKKAHICDVIDSGNYKNAYVKAKKSRELKYYPKFKQIFFWFAVNKQIWMLQFMYKLRYR